MKLVKITHERCDEISGYSYVLAPNDWDKDEIARRLLDAKKAYLAAVKDASLPPLPWVRPQQFYDQNPHKTVAEVDEIISEARDEYAREQKRRWETRRKFGEFLVDEGFASLRGSEDHAMTLHWGHRHGQQLDYVGDLVDTTKRASELAGEDPSDLMIEDFDEGVW